MRVTCTSRELQEAVKIAENAVEPRTISPIYWYLLLRAEGSALTITGTGYEKTIRVNMSARIAQEGAITVPSKTFSDLIDNTPSDREVELVSEDDTKLTVRSSGTRSRFNSFPSADFPMYTCIGDDIAISLPFGILRHSLQHVSASVASAKMGMPALMGIHISLADGSLVLSSTDGFRASRVSVPCTVSHDQSGGDYRAIIPVSTASAICKFPFDDDTDAIIYLNRKENALEVVVGNDLDLGVRIKSQCISGIFPTIDSVFLSEHTTSITLASGDLKLAINRAFAMARGVSNSISLHIKDDSLLMISSSDYGKSESILSGKVIGEGSIMINGRYLADAIDSADSDMITIHIGDRKQVILITNGSDNTDDYKHIVLPMVGELETQDK